jgi:hypothetical protein
LVPLFIKRTTSFLKCLLKRMMRRSRIRRDFLKVMKLVIS